MTYSLEKLQDVLEDALSEVAKTKVRINNWYGEQSIPCAECNKSMIVKESTLVDVEYYVQPYSCTGGDYWSHQEYRVVCQHCSIHNRIMLSDYDLPYSAREKISNRREYMFFSRYYDSFKEKISMKDTDRFKTVNNNYVEANLTDYVEKSAIEQRNKAIK